METRWGAKGARVGPVAAVEVAELPSPSQVRPSHLAKQNQVILPWKVRSAEKGEWAALWVSLRNLGVSQVEEQELQSEVEVPSKVDALSAAAG